MLTSLHVKNMALIRDVELVPEKGLNVLSGETGAGKSILLESILLCLGLRGDKELIRTGTESAFVELAFSVEDPETLERLKALDVYPEDGEVRFSRRLTEKKSVSKINGETVTLSVMKAAAALLIDLYAQNEQRTLLDEANYGEILDEFAASALEDQLKTYREAYKAYRARKEEITALGSDDEERRRTLDFMAFEIAQIEKADLKPGEEDRLKKEYEKRTHSALVREGLDTVSALSEEAGDRILRSVRALQDVSKYDESLSEVTKVLTDAESLLTDAANHVKTRLLDLGEEDGDLPVIESRLDEIARFKRKYGANEEEILKTLAKRKAEYATLKSLDERKEALLANMEEAKKNLILRAEELRAVRVKVAEEFSGLLTEALRTLNFLSVSFETRVTETNRYTAKGADEVMFLISVNPGEPVKPLYKVASGGELSRVMLAIKTITSGRKAGAGKTLIFDEVDSGISGKTAYLVGEKLAEISKKDQVILISHLPQIVSLADRHFKIEKNVEGGETVTIAYLLTEEESLREVARLLGTGEITEASLRNAREMKNNRSRAKAAGAESEESITS